MRCDLSFLIRTAWVLAIASISLGGRTADAQLMRGGEVRVEALATAEERSAQNDLWVMEVYFKPLRLITVDTIDPATGERRPEFVWYLAYRAVNRPIARRTEDNVPINVLDPPVNQPLFIPEFTLLVTDNDRAEAYTDVIIPEALPVINAREKGNYLDSVSIVQPVPAPIAPGKPVSNMIEGVATWRGIDPNADRYTIFMQGFSNGIRVIPSKDGGDPVIQNKTIMQQYWRPGDEFDQREPEIRPDGDPKWIYR